MSALQDWHDIFQWLIAEMQRIVVARTPFVRDGKLDLTSPNIVGSVPPARGGSGGTAGAEPPLGNPAALGYLLTSTPAGVRSWRPLIAGPGITLDVNPTTGAITVSVAASVQTLTFGADDLTWGGDTLTWGAA